MINYKENNSPCQFKKEHDFGSGEKCRWCGLKKNPLDIKVILVHEPAVKEFLLDFNGFQIHFNVWSN